MNKKIDKMWAALATRQAFAWDAGYGNGWEEMLCTRNTDACETAGSACSDVCAEFEDAALEEGDAEAIVVYEAAVAHSTIAGYALEAVLAAENGEDATAEEQAQLAIDLVESLSKENDENDELWAALATRQEHADAAGYGEEWRGMLLDKSLSSMAVAVHAAKAAYKAYKDACETEGAARVTYRMTADDANISWYAHKAIFARKTVANLNHNYNYDDYITDVADWLVIIGAEMEKQAIKLIKKAK